MGTGGKSLKRNLRERAVSADFNRSQVLSQALLAELLRRLVSSRATFGGGSLLNLGGGRAEIGGSFTDTGAMDTAAIGTPLKGDVIDGLVVLPQPGTMNLLVSPGFVILDDPDGQTGSSDPSPPSVDDSRGKLVYDAGEQTLGVLTLAAGGGGIRIDVIECRRAPNVVIETDTRDIFSPGTGTYAPTLVDKVTQQQLEYRVRQGTPGAGIPTNQQGWLPLCVASVPSSASSVDQITFWDVRPLVKDRVFGPIDVQRAMNQNEKNGEWLAVNPESSFVGAVTTIPVKGIVVSQYGMYRAGGDIDIDANNVANWSNGFDPAAQVIWYLYALFPANLPRWVKYAPVGFPRVPNGPLGIIAITSQAPFLENNLGVTNLPVSLPPLTGIGGTANGTMLFAGVRGYDGFGYFTDGVLINGGKSFLTNRISVPTLSQTATSDRYRFRPSLQFPMSAKSLLVYFTGTFTGAAANARITFNPRVTVTKPGGSAQLWLVHGAGGSQMANGAGDMNFTFACEVPLIPKNQELFGDTFVDVNVEWQQSSGTISAGNTANVYGWKL